MAVNNMYPVLDGIAPSWCDIKVVLVATGGVILTTEDIKSLTAGVTVEVGEQRGASGGRVIKHTLGAETTQASWTLYRSGYQKYIRALKTIAKTLGYVRGNQIVISPVHFGIQVQHTPFGDPEIYEYRLKGCRYGGRNMNPQEGTDAEEVESPLIVKQIVDLIDGEEVVAL